MAPEHEPSMLGSYRWRIRGGAADPPENIAKGHVGTAKKCGVIHSLAKFMGVRHRLQALEDIIAKTGQ